MKKYRKRDGYLDCVDKRKMNHSVYYTNIFALDIKFFSHEDAGFIKEWSLYSIKHGLYSGETIEGYDLVKLPYPRFKDDFSAKIMPTYHEALQKITGVYCLTDTSNGKLYIGSATGEGGVAQRWGNYLDSKHGGNVKLIN